MRRWLVLVSLLLVGCAAKKPVHSQFAIPGNCILGGDVERGKCHAINASLAECDGVIVKYACVKVSEK